MSEDDANFSDLVDQHFPYDGPHTRDKVVDAVHAIAKLTRYVNNATGPGNGRKTLDWNSTVYSVLGSLNGTLAGFDQLLEQLATATKRLGQDPTSYDDRRDRSAATTAADLVDLLRDARRPLDQLQMHVSAAHSTASHLGND